MRWVVILGMLCSSVVHGEPCLALVIRSHSGEAQELLVLLRSAELFWPIDVWEVVVVLDAESSRDDRFVLLLPSWVRVVFEAPPNHFDAYFAIHRKGYLRAQYSVFLLDHYTQARYIAFADADTIFSLPVDAEHLFEHLDKDRGCGLKPVIFGERPEEGFWHHFKPAAFLLGYDVDDPTFMVAFPFVVMREHFAEARGDIQEIMASQVESFTRAGTLKPSSDSFADAFFVLQYLSATQAIVAFEPNIGRSTPLEAQAAIQEWVREGRKVTSLALPCGVDLVGRFLHARHREDYAWAIAGNPPRYNGDPFDLCPWPSVMIHLGPLRHFFPETYLNFRGTGLYFDEALSRMEAGVCISSHIHKCSSKHGLREVNKNSNLCRSSTKMQSACRLTQTLWAGKGHATFTFKANENCGERSQAAWMHRLGYLCVLDFLNCTGRQMTVLP
eukprot:gnl/MRDRNA2_/MRDRNA2_170128_c0_seq1.p1 gnl/MRDRNA2_/MRDRNA2_170128_c0~~gnl/MRDRNA2_/MRDRNA2_170128_c0_seq1.p1  ORF type:complete len:443 (+),score=54.07 gnl/MRDRNA2_/MRDRNA2_170128_c0_seq1:29-1357(+)